ncbi:uncharacterized protein HMPREF1541_09814 [Cyphellophora europaea CBS 101466]|uniref:Uncharacterized protein n=1 Tax=Cyphellophora europaea (strain CBS 101466) TaxID=1220924 RepID=W2SAL8_CYPE1|nr:uncharacterized protein HMPREF1541_09814 [Cyphellophora europaea CBS 101466]ETN44939.1 hypothetical protein HMPREF1541_09814 [Cyphellophora europaea CBS 101466]
MDFETDQRRQINRNNRTHRDKLSDKLLTGLRTAPLADAQALLDAIRQDTSSEELEALAHDLSQRWDSGEAMSAIFDGSPTDRQQNDAYNSDGFLVSPSDSEVLLSLDVRRDFYIAEGARQFAVGGEGMDVGKVMSTRSTATDRLSQVMLSFREAASEQIVGGAVVADILSLSGLDLDLFFRERVDSDPHTISTWACEFAKSWTSMSPISQVALVYLAGSFMRWFILPCQTTYGDMSSLLLPIKGNARIHNPAEVDYCRAHAARRINSLTMHSQKLQWPYTYLACLEKPDESASPFTSPTRRLSKMFMQYCDDLRNWTQ